MVLSVRSVNLLRYRYAKSPPIIGYCAGWDIENTGFQVICSWCYCFLHDLMNFSCPETSNLSLLLQLQEAQRKLEELNKEQESLIDIFSEERVRRDQEEENLRKKLKVICITSPPFHHWVELVVRAF